MENVIRKAIEGGYQDILALMSTYQGIPYEMMRVAFNRCILDPLFWQSLSKACVWKGYKFYFEGTWQYTEDPGIEVQSRTPFVYELWKANALRFHEINLTEGWNKAVEWLDSIVK